MSAASNYLEDKLLDHTLRGTSAPYTAPNPAYVALFADSGAAASGALESGTNSTSGVGNWGYYEVLTTGSTNYARQSISFGAAGQAGGNAVGTIKTNATVSFYVAGADYETAGTTGNVITHIAIMDQSTGGNVLFYGALTTAKTVSNGDQFTISSGNLSISLA